VKSWDVIIAGAGIIGVSIALEVRERGATVLVLDSAEPGAEASSAAAGMLTPSDPETPPALRPMALESARLFPSFVGKVEAASDMLMDFRVGTIALMPAEIAPPSEYRSLSAAELQKLEPTLQSSGLAAFYVREDSVDPRLLMQAAVIAAQNSGVEIRGHTAVKAMSSRAGEAEIATDKELFVAHSAIDCRGAWSGAPVRPRKGQMLYVQPAATVLEHVLRAPDVYVVPRSSGQILVGATVEDVGFDKSVNPAAIQHLLCLAAKYVPELAGAPITQTWAGLRPGTPDDLPLIGPTGQPRVFAASGHFRNGILLAPITARIVADLIEGRPSSLDISPFAPGRFGGKAE
jgi:glycine oxidase